MWARVQGAGMGEMVDGAPFCAHLQTEHSLSLRNKHSCPGIRFWGGDKESKGSQRACRVRWENPHKTRAGYRLA